jgi:large subunit ribosomal protein L10
MDKEQKAAAVAELTDDLKGVDAVFAIDYRGISVTGAAELRRSLAEADAVFKVVKNRLAKRAAADAGVDELDELLVGPTALTLINGDAVIAAKAISDFSRQHDVLAYKGGFMDGEPLDADSFSAIARLPGLDMLRGQLVGITASPLTGLASGLNNLLSGLGRQLSQMAEQGLVSGEAAGAEQAPAEPDAEQPEEPAAEPESEAPAEAEEAAEPASAEQETSEEPAAEPEAPEETESEDQAQAEE